MRRTLIAAAALVWVAAAQAQTRTANPIADLQWLFIEDTVSLIAPPSAEAGVIARAAMDRAAVARAAGKNGEMRRQLAQARVVLAGGAWGRDAEFLHSLELLPGHRAADTDEPLTVRIGQFYEASPASTVADAVELALGVKQSGETAWRASTHWQAGAPAEMTIPLAELRDGSAVLVVQARQGGHVIGETALTIEVAGGLRRDLAAIERRRAGLRVSGAMAAALAWPGDLVRTLDDGTRQVVRADLRAALDRTLALLAEAEAGRDPLRRAKAEREGYYFSKVSGRIEPFRLAVPPCWNGKTRLPLVVLLHGSNGDHNRAFAGGKAAQLAQQHCWAVLAPMGYSPNGGWGNHLPVVLADGTMPAPRPSTIAEAVLPKDGVDPEPAEADVFDAIAAVRAAYPIDSRRIYLAGNSMGGEGTWHLAQLRPDFWAAIAPGAGAIAPADYPYAQLGTLPVLAVHGDKDEIISHAASAEMIGRLNRAGGNGELLTVPGGGHRSFDTVLDQVFAFFARHIRSR